MLPTPKNPIGYDRYEIKEICKKRNIKLKDFDKAFGVNTVGVAPDGTNLLYVCDVERALYKLRKPDGKYHIWD